jgi:dTDP-4-amino-4,6-dideoxygalactose transaminase
MKHIIQLYSLGEIKEELAVLPKYFERLDTMGGVNNRHIPKLEEKFSKLSGRIATSINSCTNGVYLALKYQKLNNEPVFVPPITFFGIGSSIIKAGGIPVFTRTDKHGLMDVESVIEFIDYKWPKKAKVAVPCHINSRHNDISQLQGHIDLVEDAAPSFGTKNKYGECIVSSTSNISIISFSYGKPLTAGEGGMMFSNSETSQWIKGHRYCGLDNLDGQYGYGVFNVHEPDLKFPFHALGATLIREKIRKFDQQLLKRQQIAAYYQTLFGHLNHADFYSNGNQITYMLLCNNKEQRDQVQSKLDHNGIKSYLNHRPMFLLDAFKNFPGIPGYIESTMHYFDRVLHIPCRHDLSDSEVEHIATTTHKALL